MDYFILNLNLVGIWIILAVSFNLLVGYTRLFSITHAAFLGFGAYTSAILTTQFGVNFLVAIAAGIIVSVALGAIVSIPSLRVRGDYLFIASLGFQTVAFTVFSNWDSLTGGVNGIGGIPKPDLFGFQFSSNASFTVLIYFFVAVCCFLLWRLLRSPFGRVLKGIREDEQATQALGKNILAFKVAVFIIAGSFAAIAGSLYAHLATYVDPSNFSVTQSVLILVMVMLGGAGNLWGPIIGVVLMLMIPQVIGFAPIPASMVGPINQVIFNAVLILFLVFRPQGLLPEHKLDDGKIRAPTKPEKGTV